jgi:hypothetical protein
MAREGGRPIDNPKSSPGAAPRDAAPVVAARGTRGIPHPSRSRPQAHRRYGVASVRGGSPGMDGRLEGPRDMVECG